MQLRLTHYGETILRQSGQPVTQFDEKLQALVNDMIETMYAEEGVGLAAQQVDRDLRLCVVDVSHIPDEELEYRLDGLTPPVDLIMPMALANPEVIELPGPTPWAEEGCLSFPGIRGEVPRAHSIQVSFQDVNGQPHTLACSGWFARVIQHEVDHLNGKLFIDHMDKRKLRLLDSKLKRLKRDTRRNLKSLS